MPVLTRRFTRHPWLLLIVPILLSAAFATAAVAPPVQDGTPPNCIEDAAGRRLQCTANDVRVARYRLVEGPTECLPGETVQVKLQAELVATAAERYDIGLFVAQDGGNARSGSCYRDFLAPPLEPDGQYNPGTPFSPPEEGQPPVYTGGGPFLTAEDEGDLCGDIEQAAPTFRDLGEAQYDPKAGPLEIEVVCQDNVDAEGNPVADQVADVATCVSWDNQANASPVCAALADTKPNNPAKCNCSYVQITGLTVPEVAHLEVIKDLVPESDPGKFDLLIDGVVRSGGDGVGDGGTTGRVEVSAGTRTAPGATHKFAEALHPGLEMDLGDYDISVVCVRRGDGAQIGTGTGPGPFSLPVMPGDDMVCTFKNERVPRLRLVKEIRNDNGGTAEVADWTLFATGVRPDGPTNLEGKSPVDSAALPINFKPDTYTLSETYIDSDPGVPTGYSAGAWSCVKTATGEEVPVTADSKVAINTGDDVTCTITNDDIQPRLKLVKKVENTYGGTATTTDFQPSVADRSGGSTNVAWDAFTGFDAGTYIAFETVLEGYTASGWTGDCASDGTITLLPGDEKTCYITNTQLPPPSGKVVCVDGYVINHREQPVDGTKTVPPLVINAVRSAPPNEVLATAPVGSDGYFKFTNLPADTPISFQLQLPEGWEGIVPQAHIGGLAVTGPTSFPERETCYRILFKIRRLVTIPVLKWEEKLDGTVARGENWQITATPIDDPWARVVTATVKNGAVDIPLTPGTWNIAETIKTGWTALLPPSVTRVVDQYEPAGRSRYPVVFKNREPVCYSSIKVTKLGFGPDATGKARALGALPGWQYTVTPADKPSPVAIKTTDGSGTVRFDNLYPGVYVVKETEQPGWDAGINPQTVVLYPCQTAELVFENYEQPAELKITGTKYLQAWEKPYKGTLVGMPGWTITAELIGVGARISTVTNALGEYVFAQEDLQGAGMAFPGAAIEVCEEERDHWIPVTPECVTVRFPYPLPPGYAGPKVDFINVQDPPS